MSYTIIYGKQFVKVNDKYIPLILAGSSNCTMFYSGREILDREWFALSPKLCTEQEVLAFAPKYTAGDTDHEYAKEGGKWIYYSQTARWFRNAIKNARTIEEIMVQSYHPLRCAIVVRDAEGRYKGEKSIAYCRTTDDILNWIYNTFEEDAEVNKEMRFSFDGIKPLALGKKCDTSRPFRVKFKNRYYLRELSERGMTGVVNKEQAKIFNNIQDFLDYAADKYARYRPITFESVR